MRTSWWSVPACAGLGVALLLSTAGASAAAPGEPPGIVSPTAGTVVEQPGPVELRALAQGPDVRPTRMLLLAPGAPAAEVVAVHEGPDSGELVAVLDPDCHPAPCAARRPAPNGEWLLSLDGATEDSRTFVLRVPPAVPEALGADPVEAGVALTWRAGAEPDLRGWRVEGAAEQAVDVGACDATGACRTVVPASTGPWRLRALRATCPDCEQVLASDATRDVQLPETAARAAAPPAEQAPAPAQRAPRPFTPSGELATVQVPALPAPAAPAPAGEAPLDTTLGYAAPATGAGADPVLDLLGARSTPVLVLAALLVALSWWLRRWARRAIAD